MAAVIFHGVGRRKQSVARAWLKRGTGVFTVNGKASQAYFPTEKTRWAVEQPMQTVDQASNFDIKVLVNGGGFNGQADATKLAIARALLEVDNTLRPALKAVKLLRVDARQVERKKPGQPGARRKFQFVKR